MKYWLKSMPFPIAPIGGIRMSFTSESTILPNAAPMTTATARSSTLPRVMNSLNSFNTGSSLVTGFAGATLCASALIFWAEPMVGKQLLPLLGGAPAVWNVCLLFFQVSLLTGYALAHSLTRLSARWQLVVFGIFLLAGLFALPVHFPTPPRDLSSPVGWLLGQLTLRLTLPFIALSAAAPLLQHWFARAFGSSAGDPYKLYAASNTGSLLALLAYPFLIEPAWSLRTQGMAWLAL